MNQGVLLLNVLIKDSLFQFIFLYFGLFSIYCC